VGDTGIGIAKEHHAAIFEDFVQVDSPIQKRLRGTGLGLSLSKRLATLLGGSVAVQSEPGVGSTFSVTIPAVVAKGNVTKEGPADAK
jgi:signal transduction histidine kinase